MDKAKALLAAQTSIDKENLAPICESKDGENLPSGFSVLKYFLKVKSNS
jgi:hypothetical protein